MVIGSDSGALISLTLSNGVNVGGRCRWSSSDVQGRNGADAKESITRLLSRLRRRWSCCRHFHPAAQVGPHDANDVWYDENLGCESDFLPRDDRHSGSALSVARTRAAMPRSTV